MRAGGKNLIAAAAVALALSLAVPGGYAAAAPRCGQAAQAPRAATDHQLRTSVLCLVNQARERHGVRSLEFSPELRRSASAHSKTMVRSGTLSHYGPSGSTPATRIVRSGYAARASSLRLAENIAAGKGRSYGSPLAIVRGWMHSPSHRRNVLDGGLRDFGVGIARGAPLGGVGGGAATYTLDLAARYG